MLLALVLVSQSGPVLIDPLLPKPSMVGQEGQIAATIWRTPYPEEPEPLDEFGTRILRIRGRKVRIAPNDRYSFVDSVEVGRDGSLLIGRRTSTDMYTVNDFIRVGKGETMVKAGRYEAFAEAYFDAKNYAGSFYTEVGAAQYPLSPPTAYVVVNGKIRVYGPGSIQKAWPDGQVVASIPIDREGRPASNEFHEGDFLRYYAPGWTQDIGRLEYVDASSDRTLLLSKGTEIYTWRAGRFLSGWRLPAGWTPVKINGLGDILVRYATPGSSNATREKTWQMAIVRKGSMVPIAYPRPKATNDSLWRDTLAFRDDGSVRFTAFGRVSGTFELRPERRPTR